MDASFIAAHYQPLAIPAQLDWGGWWQPPLTHRSGVDQESQACPAHGR